VVQDVVEGGEYVRCTQCLNDMVPAFYVELFDSLAAANDNAVMLPFAI
jgi:hypothetical protein